MVRNKSTRTTKIAGRLTSWTLEFPGYHFLLGLWKLGFIGWLETMALSTVLTAPNGIKGFFTETCIKRNTAWHCGGSCFVLAVSVSLSRILEVFSSSCPILLEGDKICWSNCLGKTTGSRSQFTKICYIDQTYKLA